MTKLLLNLCGVFYGVLCVFSIVTGLIYVSGKRELNPLELSDTFMEKYKDSCPNIHYSEFISRMALAYAMADVVISRSGASSISELCAARKAAIFVPSPNVAEDHQTHNAMALVRKDAAMIVKDGEAVDKLMEVALKLLYDPEKIQQMETNIGKLAKMDASSVIVDEAYKLI